MHRKDNLPAQYFDNCPVFRQLKCLRKQCENRTKHFKEKTSWLLKEKKKKRYLQLDNVYNETSLRKYLPATPRQTLIFTSTRRKKKNKQTTNKTTSTTKKAQLPYLATLYTTVGPSLSQLRREPKQYEKTIRNQNLCAQVC